MAVNLTLLSLHYNYLFHLKGYNFKLYKGFYYRAILSVIIKAVPTVLKLNKRYNNILINIHVKLSKQRFYLYNKVLISHLIVINFNNL